MLIPYIEKLSNDGNTSTYISKINDIKYNIIFSNMVNKKLYNLITNHKYCYRETYLLNYRLKCFCHLFDCLKKGGIFYLTIFNYCDNKTIELLYLLSFMFEYIIIYNSTFIYCYNFLDNDSIISKEKINNLIDKNFIIEPKNNLNNLITYLENNIVYKNKLLNLILDKKFDEYQNLIIDEYILDIKEQINKNIINKKSLLDFQKNIIENFKKIYIDKKLVKISSGIKQIEGNFIVKTIKKNNFKNILEIGCAFGISAFYILSIENTKLISIDPFQSTP